MPVRADRRHRRRHRHADRDLVLRRDATACCSAVCSIARSGCAALWDAADGVRICSSGMIFFTFAGATLFSWALALEGVPDAVAGALGALGRAALPAGGDRHHRRAGRAAGEHRHRRHSRPAAAAGRASSRRRSAAIRHRADRGFRHRLDHPAGGARRSTSPARSAGPRCTAPSAPSSCYLAVLCARLAAGGGSALDHAGSAARPSILPAERNTARGGNDEARTEIRRRPRSPTRRSLLLAGGGDRALPAARSRRAEAT